MKMLKNISSILLCCLLLALPVTGYTSPTGEVLFTAPEIQQLKAKLDQVNRVLELLNMDSTQQQVELFKAKAELQELNNQLTQALSGIKTAESSLKAASVSLENANKLLAQQSKEQKAAQNKLKIERTVWQIVAGAAIYYAVTK